ncbi:hypothetical protein H6P81_020729 [Aristolochia fimbriata]|uniref:Uncharacterized protein n=1 Tax=Aristolochia fimbriata TaxID=158543 RepID=A0AAV7DWA1_ARIFI|nr:hypothetical protein H6P81_020729 [Aristolochia fimbriata]
MRVPLTETEGAVPALEPGVAVDVEGLGCEADDGEGVQAAALRTHLDEQVCGGAVWVEGAFDDAGLRHRLRQRWDGDGDVDDNGGG